MIDAWTIEGSEGLPIHGNTRAPDAVEPMANVLVIHGWTGCKDRNIVPAVTRALEGACVVHRFTMSHAGIGKDSDEITRPEEFERDSLEFCVRDIARVAERATSAGAPGADTPLVLIGHSRAGATIVRCAAEEVRENWPVEPKGLVSLAGTATYTRFDEAMRAELEEKGYVEKECTRAPGGVVRMGTPWYRHHLDEPGRDIFEEDARVVRAPLLIVHGEADDAVPPDHADTVRGYLEAGVCPSVEVLYVPDADHNFNAGGFGFERDTIATPESRAATDAILRFIERL